MLKCTNHTVLGRDGVMAIPLKIFVCVSGLASCTLVAKVPSDCGMTSVSKNGIYSLGLVFFHS